MTSRSSSGRGRAPRKPVGDTDDYDLDHQLHLRVETHLWRTMEKWCAIYQNLEGPGISPQLLARRWLHLAARYMEAKLERGEIEPSKRLPPEQSLP